MYQKVVWRTGRNPCYFDSTLFGRACLTLASRALPSNTSKFTCCWQFAAWSVSLTNRGIVQTLQLKNSEVSLWSNVKILSSNHMTELSFAKIIDDFYQFQVSMDHLLWSFQDSRKWGAFLSILYKLSAIILGSNSYWIPRCTYNYQGWGKPLRRRPLLVILLHRNRSKNNIIWLWEIQLSIPFLRILWWQINCVRYSNTCLSTIHAFRSYHSGFCFVFFFLVWVNEWMNEWLYFPYRNNTASILYCYNLHLGGRLRKLSHSL